MVLYYKQNFLSAIIKLSSLHCNTLIKELEFSNVGKQKKLKNGGGNF